jgi:hypothetical protein
MEMMVLRRATYDRPGADAHRRNDHCANKKLPHDPLPNHSVFNRRK